MAGPVNACPYTFAARFIAVLQAPLSKPETPQCVSLRKRILTARFYIQRTRLIAAPARPQVSGHIAAELRRMRPKGRFHTPAGFLMSVFFTSPARADVP